MKRNLVVLCDANVLYGQWLRDLLMWLGATSLLQSHWSERIEQEWMRNLLARRPNLQMSQIERTRDRMNQTFPQARVLLPVDVPFLICLTRTMFMSFRQRWLYEPITY